MASNIVDQTPLVHRYSKDDLDSVAEEFLQKYCPEALKKLMAVPIMEIATKKMGLKVYTDYRLTEDFSVFGQMCFTSGLAEIYDKDEDEYREIKVRRGTMFIDPDTYLKKIVDVLIILLHMKVFIGISIETIIYTAKLWEVIM